MILNQLLEKLAELTPTFSAIFEFLIDKVSNYWFSLTVLVLVVCVGYYYLQRPMNIVRKLHDLGYVTEKGYSAKETANWAQRLRKIGEIPPVIPNGWYGIVQSMDLKTRQVKSVNVLGLNLAVFRGEEDGMVHALDAYCPHLGANLAAGGRVLGDCLECPFHGWRFQGSDGKCTSIPYAENVPDFAKVKSWPVEEKNGMVFLWYHAEGEEPTWTLPEIPEITEGTCIFRGRTEHIVNCHIQGMFENGADCYHFKQVHSAFVATGGDIRHIWSKFWSFCQHLFEDATWEPLPEPQAHVSELKFVHSLSVFGRRPAFLKIPTTIRQIGPSVNYVRAQHKMGLEVKLYCNTPITPLVVKVVSHSYFSPSVPALVANLAIRAETVMAERDLMLWNNLKFTDKPMFVTSKEDSSLAQHRRWYSQFYSKNSPRLLFHQDSLEW